MRGAIHNDGNRNVVKQCVVDFNSGQYLMLYHIVGRELVVGIHRCRRVKLDPSVAVVIVQLERQPSIAVWRQVGPNVAVVPDGIAQLRLIRSLDA
ncbi:hypothetical protein D3C79_651820 [compost metagenome]